MELIKLNSKSKRINDPLWDTSKEHHYNLIIQWTGNTGSGTSGYRAYDRSHTVTGGNKADIQASSDPAFRGDKTKYNPEELLVAALSGCHMLSFLHLCADAGVLVIDYKDQATGTMIQTPDGGGHFTEVILNPIITVADVSMVDKANGLHHKASEQCFIASSASCAGGYCWRPRLKSCGHRLAQNHFRRGPKLYMGTPKVTLYLFNGKSRYLVDLDDQFNVMPGGDLFLCSKKFNRFR